MRGILRPCRHGLGPDLHTQWVGHLCGLCVALRDRAGQPARVLTGYDVLLVSILTEAQTGRLATTTAGACPLRGFRTAEVVDASSPAMRAGTAVALLAGSAGLADKLNDGDTPVWLRPIASRSAQHLVRVGMATAEECGFDGTDLSEASSRAKAVECRVQARLDELLEPAGTAVAAVFAHTAVAAGMPGNAAPLRRAGDAFGRMVHLVDATEDRQSDRKSGHFNPLEATGTSDAEAGELARSLHAKLLGCLDEVEFADGALAGALLGPTLRSAIDRVWGSARTGEASLPFRRRGGALVGIAAALAAQAAMWSGGRRGRRWGRDPYGDPYGGPYGGRGRRRGCLGLSCGELLACDCCANCCCNSCCGDDENCCCCAV